MWGGWVEGWGVGWGGRSRVIMLIYAPEQFKQGN
jgi:hypothetical protein